MHTTDYLANELPINFDSDCIDSLLNNVKLIIDFSKEAPEDFGVEESSGLRHVHTTQDAILDAKFKFLNSFMKSLAATTTELPNVLAKIIDNDIGYCFPDEVTFDKYCKEVNKEDVNKNSFVNINEDKTRAWVLDFINDIKENQNKSKCLRIIGGKVGSGKTSFVKFISIAYLDLFQKNNIVVAPIHYKLPDNNIVTRDKAEWQCLIESQIIDSVVKSIIDDCDSSEIQFLLDYFVKSVKADNGIDSTQLNPHSPFEIELNSNSNIIKNAFDRNDQSLAAKNKRFKKLDSVMKSTIIEYYIQHKHRKLLIIIDGLDQISIPAITYGGYKNAFDALSDLIICEDFLPTIPDIYINYLVMLRHCSYETFIERNLREHQLTFCYHHLIPAGLRNILIRGVKYYLSENEDKEFTTNNKSNLINYANQMMDICAKAFKIADERELGELFDYNYRKMIRYFNQVTKYIVNKTANSNNPPENLSDLINVYFIKPGFIKRYTLYEIMLLDNQPAFNNYNSTRMTAMASVTPEIQPNDQKRGYIDNIYNYHIVVDPNFKTPMLLFKLRLLQLLRRKDKYQTIDNITDLLEKFGYKVSLVTLTTTINMLMSSGFIKVKRDDGLLKYNATNLSKHLVDYLATELRYMEYTVQATLLSTLINDDISSTNKYDKYSKWVYHSIINAYIFYLYISCVERNELKYMTDNNHLLYINKKLGDNWQIASKVKDELSNAIVNILKTPVDGLKYLNASNLIKNINNKIDSWKKLGIVSDTRELQ